jgi:hypothetical protein
MCEVGYVIQYTCLLFLFHVTLLTTSRHSLLAHQVTMWKSNGNWLEQLYDPLIVTLIYDSKSQHRTKTQLSGVRSTIELSAHRAGLPRGLLCQKREKPHPSLSFFTSPCSRPNCLSRGPLPLGTIMPKAR